MRQTSLLTAAALFAAAAAAGPGPALAKAKVTKQTDQASPILPREHRAARPGQRTADRKTNA